MRKNLPVSQVEIPLTEHCVIFSTTDKQGRITAANQAFVDISGYRREELIGAPHNVLRHPDVPPAVFANMWDTLHAGKAWLGIVKNRCKNGDHYWVEAFVSPLYENEQLVGYQSVRVKAERNLIEGAEQLYKAVWNEQSCILSMWNLRRWPLSLQVACLLASGVTALTITGVILLAATGNAWLSGLLLLPVALASSWAAGRAIGNHAQRLVAASRTLVDNPLMQQLFVGSTDEIGQLQYEARVLRARNRTAMARLAEFSDEISTNADEQSHGADSMAAAVRRQEQATCAVAAAIEELTATIQGVVDGTRQSSQIAAQGVQTVDSSSHRVQQIIADIRQLAAQIQQSNEMMTALGQQTDTIAKNLGEVSGIAKKTHLLALNAAIEAARSGEAGKGFAVVAQEVRDLSMLTAQYSERISASLDELQRIRRAAAEVSANSRNMALAVADNSGEISSALADIRNGVAQIDSMSSDISFATGEQAKAIEEINHNMANLNQDGQKHSLVAEDLRTNSARLKQMAEQLTLMVEQFKL